MMYSMDDHTLGLQKYFNNREIATGIWLLVGVIFILYKDKTRDSLKELLHATLQKKVLILFASLAIYLIGLCWLLSKACLWTSVQASATFLWFFLSGIALLGRSLAIKDDDRYFKKLILDSFKVAMIFEFLVVAYTYSLLTELLLVPLLAFLGAMIGFSAIDKKYQSVKMLFETITAVIVVILLWHSLSLVWESPSDFFTTQNGRTFLLPIFLTIGSIPLFYLWYCYSSYETAAISIGFKKIHSTEIKKYAKCKFFFTFFFKPWLLQRAVRQFHLLPEVNNESVKNIIKFIQFQEGRTKNPPAVSEKEGWSPYLARDFLKAHGLKTSDYHTNYYDNEWFARSSNVELDDHFLSSQVSFYLSGQAEIVNKLKLTGCFYTETDLTEALTKLRLITLDLTKASLGISNEEAELIIPDKSQFEININGTLISSWVEKYPSNKGFFKYLLFSRDLAKN